MEKSPDPTCASKDRRKNRGALLLGRAILPLLSFAWGSWVGLRPPPPPLVDGSFPAGKADLLVPASPDFGEAANLVALLPRLNPEARAERAWLLADGPRRGQGPGVVTFTFDDGPFPETTPILLHTLKKYGIHATFFLLGKYLAGTDERCVLARRVAEEIVHDGHAIGNHTYDHQLLTNLDLAEATREIDRGASAIQRTLGQAPKFFRPPYGGIDAPLEAEVARRGLDLVLWNIEVSDMQRDDSERMAEELKSQIVYNGGGIVLLHDIRWPTVKALPKVLEWLAANRFNPQHPERGGYEVVGLAEFLRRTARDPSPYRDRRELEQARAKEWQHLRRAAAANSEVAAGG